ncbi:PcfJ domain-containing protein [Hymenobacter sp. BT186]|uniref:PcfJ domain-containing protein n=1 Tax=Hymenobacter telluris TaxID=2816474 RepID=A0A939EVU9_9BACT|nr:PcfJ domain-containing protein [Hymenobacter telluris]MBO0358157.1 PcfJ domain-containing protein [Hymenobacter telluris]MBW3374184.1 PcfJ domain-containing protein [Hymenobacter norwichensis]
MSNRLKPLPHAVWQAQQARIVLSAAKRLDWRRWPLSRQVDYLFSLYGPLPVIQAQLGENSALAQFYEHCIHEQQAAHRNQCARLLRSLATKRTELLWRPEVASALAVVARWLPQRCRELADWQPRSRNPFRQLESLVRHLFDQYGDVPAWVINSWTAGRLHDGLNIAELTVHLGRGGALRTFRGLPGPLSRKVEHHLRLAPAGYPFLYALRYAQLAARDQLAWLGPVLDSRLSRYLGRDDEFWLRVVDFFAAAPMVDPYQLGPVCDWIHQKRTVGVNGEPAQPGFSLKGRSMNGVLTQTAQWHRQLTQASHRTPEASLTLGSTWEPMPIPDFSGGGKCSVRITQLRTYGDLLDEGRTLRHCVASYLDSCRRGRSAIFSLTLNDTRTVTLEVQANRTIVQARGLFNRRPNDEESAWIQRWAADNCLLIPKHLLGWCEA